MRRGWRKDFILVWRLWKIFNGEKKASRSIRYNSEVGQWKTLTPTEPNEWGSFIFHRSPRFHQRAMALINSIWELISTPFIFARAASHNAISVYTPIHSSPYLSLSFFRPVYQFSTLFLSLILPPPLLYIYFIYNLHQFLLLSDIS